MRLNQSGQFVAAQMNSRTDGSPLTTGVSVLVTVNGGTQTAGGGTLTHKGNGHWSYALTAAESNGAHIAFTFTHATGVHQTVNTYPVNWNPADGIRLGLTALPNAAAEAAGGLYTRGTGAGQINQQTNGQIDSNVERQRNAVIAALSTSGFNQAMVVRWLTDNVAGTPGALVANRTDASVGDIAAGQLAAIVNAVWDELKAGHAVAGSFGDFLDKKISEVSVVASGSALNKLADSFTLTTGTVLSGSITDTVGADQVYHQIGPTAGEVDVYYEFILPPGRVPVSVAFVGRSEEAVDSMRVSGFRWATSAWVQVATIPGQKDPPDITIAANMFASMVGTGVDAGKVRVRLHNTGLTAPAILYVDQIVVGYATDANELIFSGAVTAAGPNYVELTSDAVATDDYYKPALIQVRTGTGAGQTRRVDSYIGSSRRVVVATPWAVQPDVTSVIDIWPWASVRVSDMDVDVIGSAQIANGAIGASEAPNLDAAITSRSSHSAADVWSVVSRTLTGLGFTLGAADLAADTIGASQFAQGAADKVWLSAARTLTAMGFQLGSSDFAAGFLTAALIASDAIQATKIQNGAITGAKFAAGAIDATVAPNLDAAVSSRATPAQVNSEVDTALADIHLDHLLATVTAAFPGDAGSILGELIERITTWRFNAEALSQAPAGGGGGGGTDWTTGEKSQIRDALGVDGSKVAAVNGQLQGKATSAQLATHDTDLKAALSTHDTDVKGRLPAALVSGRMDSDVGAINGNAPAADNLSRSARGIVPLTVAGVPTTTSIPTDLLEGTDDHYKGAVVVFITGALTGQRSDITAYNGSNGTLTVTALTDAPSAGDLAVII